MDKFCGDELIAAKKVENVTRLRLAFMDALRNRR